MNEFECVCSIDRAQYEKCNKNSARRLVACAIRFNIAERKRVCVHA